MRQASPATYKSYRRNAVKDIEMGIGTELQPKTERTELQVWRLEVQYPLKTTQGVKSLRK